MLDHNNCCKTPFYFSGFVRQKSDHLEGFEITLNEITGEFDTLRILLEVVHHLEKLRQQRYLKIGP